VWQGGDGDGGALAERLRARRIDGRESGELVDAARMRKRPGFSQRASTCGAASPRCGCSAASAVA